MNVKRKSTQSPQPRRKPRKEGRTNCDLAVNGPLIQSLRLQLGLTQEELARKSGYTDRLIRKAEASGVLRRSSIQDLAESLSSNERRITVDTLVRTRESQFDALRIHLLGTEEHVNDAQLSLGDTFRLLIAGQNVGIPFAGEFSGKAAIQQFRAILRESSLTLVESDAEHLVLTSTSHVAIQGSMRILTTRHRSVLESVWWTLTARFRVNDIQSAMLRFDTGAVVGWLLTNPETARGMNNSGSPQNFH